MSFVSNYIVFWSNWHRTKNESNQNVSAISESNIKPNQQQFDLTALVTLLLFHVASFLVPQLLLLVILLRHFNDRFFLGTALSNKKKSTESDKTSPSRGCGKKTNDERRGGNRGDDTASDDNSEDAQSASHAKAKGKFDAGHLLLTVKCSWMTLVWRDSRHQCSSNVQTAHDWWTHALPPLLIRERLM